MSTLTTAEKRRLAAARARCDAEELDEQARATASLAVGMMLASRAVSSRRADG